MHLVLEHGEGVVYSHGSMWFSKAKCCPAWGMSKSVCVHVWLCMCVCW